MKIFYFLSLLFFVLFLFTPGSAFALEQMRDGYVNQSYNVVQVCNGATYVTISITSPNNTIDSGISMVDNGNGLFIYSYIPYMEGRYDIVGISDGCTETFSSYFLVKPQVNRNVFYTSSFESPIVVAVIFFGLIITSIIMFVIKYYKVSGSILLLMGFTLMFSGFPLLISISVIVMGVLCWFLAK